MFEKSERGRIQRRRKFFGVPPIISGMGIKLYELQIWQVYSDCPCEQNPIENLGEKGAWAYPGTSQIF